MQFKLSSVWGNYVLLLLISIRSESDDDIEIQSDVKHVREKAFGITECNENSCIVASLTLAQ